MRYTKLLLSLALFVPFTLTVAGCGGSDEAGQMASDEELSAYGKEAAKGTGLEGLRSESK